MPYRYGIDEHVVITKDGFRLQLFRIIGKNKDSEMANSKQPVYFQHGLLDSSDGWICNYENNCLPFIMCNRGFDIWIGNSRGNKHSKFCELEEEDGREKVNSAEFWDFSFHEMGIYDLPATFDKIQSLRNNFEKIIYIGHSQGGSSFLAGMSEKSEYFQEKLKTAVLFAPASRLLNYNSSLLSILKDFEISQKFKEKKMFEILPYNPNLSHANIKIGKVYPTLHYAMMEMLTDEVSLMNCPERIKVFTAHYPSGTSLKSFVHFQQLVDAQSFQHYDYGEEENLKRYNSPTPKQYDLSKINGVPVIICVGKNDKLTHIDDVRWLKNQIGQDVFSYYEFDHMGHSSFLINNDITWFNYVLRDIYKILEKEKCVKSDMVKNNNIKSASTDTSTNLSPVKEGTFKK